MAIQGSRRRVNLLMTHRPGHLPDFEASPLTEVALSVQFQQIPNFSFVDIGLLWNRFRSRFSRVEYHPPIPPSYETFGLNQGGIQQFQFNFAMAPPLPRSWFIDTLGNEVLQFQPDRFTHNWRKVGTGDAYPRYEQIRARFAAELDELASYLSERNLGSLIPNQCEITYVNIICTPDHRDATSRIFNGWNAVSGKYLGDTEDVAFTLRFVINNGEGDPVKRVVAQSAPGLDDRGRPAIQFIMVGRGPPSTPTLGGALEFMDLAREKVVCGFAELTTETMHQAWKRKT